MIPGVMVDFLGRASVALASTRDQACVPYLHLVTGWVVEEGAETIRCLIPAPFTINLMESVAVNGPFAMTVEKIGPHETYQFIGPFVGAPPLTETDHGYWRACTQRFVQDVQTAHPGQFNQDDLVARCPEPAVAVRFRVEKVFVQTPGPAAGALLYSE